MATSGLSRATTLKSKLAPFAVFFRGSKAQRNPQITVAEPAGIERELKIARHDADDRVRAAVEVDGMPEYIAVRLEPVFP